jgi:Arc-like DNA binding domain
MEKERLRPVMVRLPERLRRELATMAAENRRSMNTEIITRLDRSLELEASQSRDMRRHTEDRAWLEDMEGRLMGEFKRLAKQVSKALTVSKATTWRSES